MTTTSQAEAPQPGTSQSDASQPHAWQPPAPGPLPRGTVILLPGRGEHGGVYERLGRRLSFDAYAVHALDVTTDDDPGVVAKQITAISAHAVTPVVLAGSDTGALQALALVANGAVTVDGLLLAGLPSRDSQFGASAGPTTSDPDSHPTLNGAADAAEAAAAAAIATAAANPAASIDVATTWDDELTARTTCPAHRSRLTDDPRFTKGSLSDPIPSHLDLSSPSLEFDGVRIPVLLLHGGADTVSPVAIAREVAQRLPRAELAVTKDGRHDVLNDATHRTVTAHVVQWLERLRNSPHLTPIIVAEEPQSALVTQ